MDSEFAILYWHHSWNDGTFLALARCWSYKDIIDSLTFNWSIMHYVDSDRRVGWRVKSWSPQFATGSRQDHCHQALVSPMEQVASSFNLEPFKNNTARSASAWEDPYNLLGEGINSWSAAISLSCAWRKMVKLHHLHAWKISSVNSPSECFSYS